MSNPTAMPLRFFLLGATGRTGLPFLAQALARSHTITIFIRNASKLTAALSSHPRLRTVEGELHDTAKMTQAMAEAKPHVVLSMLASERPPYTAVSTGTHSALQAIAAARRVPIPFISIAAWGFGPTRVHLSRPARAFAAIVTALLWSKPLADFEKQLAEIEVARNDGLIQPILILPPILTNGKKTNTYLSGEAGTIKDFMGVTHSVSRASMADLCLKIAEAVASGEQMPQWIGITNPR